MDDKKTGTPDAGAASMAYMPGDDGKSEANKDAEISIDKKSEKKTMADIASELEAEDKVTKSDAVKVAVGGAAAGVAKSKKKPVSPSVQDELGNLDEKEATPELPDLGDDAPVPTKPAPAVAKKRSKGKLLAVFLVIALVIAGIFGFLWYKNSSKVSQLNTQVSELEASKTSLESQLEEAQDSPTTAPSPTTPVTTTTIRTMPELGLGYKLTDSTKKVSYYYTETVDSAAAVHSVVMFGSTDLVGAERKVVTDPTKYACATNDAPLGALTSYKANDTVPGGGKASALKIDNKTNFKFNETYYVFTASQSVCSTDKTVQGVQTSAKTYITELLSTLAISK